MLNFIQSDTFRRIVAGLVGVLLPMLNQKLKLEIPTEQVVATITLIAGYIVQSGIKSSAQIKADAHVEASKVNTMAKADAVLKP